MKIQNIAFRFNYMMLLGVLVLMMTGTAQSADKAQDDDDHADEPAVEITEKQRKLLDLRISQAKTGSLENIIQLPGEIQLNMDRTANMMPRMPGFVTEVLVSEGDTVKKGQVLAKITSHKLGEYFSDYNMALEQEKITKTELEMAQKLYQQQTMSQKDYLRYRKDHADAIVTRERAEIMLKSLNLNGDHSSHVTGDYTKSELICTLYEVKAPWDGTVLKKDITVGENFAEDNTKVIFVISDMSHPWLDLRADESEISHIEKGMAVEIKTSSPIKSKAVSLQVKNTLVNAAPAETFGTYQGKVIYVAPIIDEATRTGLVRVAIENPDSNVRPGSFATGTLKLSDDGASVLVPADAVQLMGGETVVFVPDSDGFSPRDVRTGKSENGYIQILAGLAADEKYVSHGAFGLKAILMTSGMVGDGHGH